MSATVEWTVLSVPSDELRATVLLHWWHSPINMHRNPAGQCGGVTCTSPAYSVVSCRRGVCGSGLAALQKALPWPARSHSARPVEHSGAQEASQDSSWDSHRTPTSKSCRTGTQPMPWTSTWGICLSLTRRDSTSSSMHPIETILLCKIFCLYVNKLYY